MDRESWWGDHKLKRGVDVKVESGKEIHVSLVWWRVEDVKEVHGSLSQGLKSFDPTYTSPECMTYELASAFLNVGTTAAEASEEEEPNST